MAMRGNKHSFAATPLPKAILLSLFQQAVVLILGCLVLDGGALLQTCVYGIAAYWIGFCVIWLRRGAAVTKLDVALIRWGFIPLCIVSFFVTGCIWHLRGYDNFF
jgi:hypothetical protein